MRKSKCENKNTDRKTVKLTKKQNIVQTVKFVIFSATAGVIQTLTFTLMNELASLPYWPSYLTALVLSVLYNFTLNRKFTFKSANNVPVAMLKIAAYYAVFTPLSTLWGEALTRIGWNEYLVLFATMIVNLITEFLFTKFVVYRNSINTSAYSCKEGGAGSLRKIIFGKLKLITPNPDDTKILDELCVIAENQGGAAFIGDGTTALYANYFFGRAVYNLGINGDTTDGVLGRLPTQIVPLSPSKIFIMIGANDLVSGRAPQYVADNVGKITAAIREKLPNAKIYIISLLPANSRVLMGHNNENIIKTNGLLRQSGNAVFVDLYSEFADAKGNLKPEYTSDGLHPGYKGCLKLRELILPYLDE